MIPFLCRSNIQLFRTMVLGDRIHVSSPGIPPYFNLMFRRLFDIFAFIYFFIVIIIIISAIKQNKG